MSAFDEDATCFDECLLRFQRRDPAADDEFQLTIWPYLIKLSRKIAPYLPEDLHRDVAQQATLYLLTGYNFNRQRATAKTFLRLVVRNAVRKVWADNRPPGLRSRRRKVAPSAESEESLLRPEDLTSDVVPFDQLDEKTCAVSAHKVLIARSEVESLLALADPLVAEALQMIHCDGEKLSEAASVLGVSRFTLTREISKFQSQMKQMVSATPIG